MNQPALSKKTEENPSTFTPSLPAFNLDSIQKTFNKVKDTAASLIIDAVRHNKVLISENHVNSGAAVNQLSQDLSTIAASLRKAGIDIGDPQKDLYDSLRKLQEHALIGENGEVYVRMKDGLHRINRETGEITADKYSGSFKGLVADGIAGPRSYYVIDALLGRGKANGGMMDFSTLKEVTNQLWDKSQVPESQQALAGDASWNGKNLDWTTKNDLEKRAKDIIENDPSVRAQRVPRACFRYSWLVAGKLLNVGIDSALNEGETNGDKFKDTSVRGKSLLDLKNMNLQVGDVVYINKNPGTDPQSLNLANKPHWAVVVGTDNNGSPIFSDNWGTFPADRFASAFAGRVVDEVYRNSRKASA